MKLHKTLSLLSLTFLLTGCSSASSASVSDSSNNLHHDKTNNYIDEEYNADNQGDIGTTKIEDESSNTSSDLTTDPNTFYLGEGCEDLGSSHAMFHFPDLAAKESLKTFDVYIGHSWYGAWKSSAIKVDQCSFRLFQVYGKAPLSMIDNCYREFKRVEVAQIKDFNTEAYECHLNMRKGTLTFNQFIRVNIEGFFDLDEGECGYLTYYLDILDKDGNELDADVSIGGTCTSVHFILENRMVKFRCSTMELKENI